MEFPWKILVTWVACSYAFLIFLTKHVHMLWSLKGKSFKLHLIVCMFSYFATYSLIFVVLHPSVVILNPLSNDMTYHVIISTLVNYWWCIMLLFHQSHHQSMFYTDRCNDNMICHIIIFVNVAMMSCYVLIRKRSIYHRVYIFLNN